MKLVLQEGWKITLIFAEAFATLLVLLALVVFLVAHEHRLQARWRAHIEVVEGIGR